MGWRILVFDDDRLLRETLAEAFQAEGHTVQEAEHGARALELLATVASPGSSCSTS